MDFSLKISYIGIFDYYFQIKIHLSTTDQNKRKISSKKSGFVSSEFVKTCDEFVL